MTSFNASSISLLGLGFTTSNGTPFLFITCTKVILIKVLMFKPKSFKIFVAFSFTCVSTFTLITLVKLDIIIISLSIAIITYQQTFVNIVTTYVLQYNYIIALI